MAPRPPDSSPVEKYVDSGVQGSADRQSVCWRLWGDLWLSPEVSLEIRWAGPQQTPGRLAGLVLPQVSFSLTHPPLPTPFPGSWAWRCPEVPTGAGEPEQRPRRKAKEALEKAGSRAPGPWATHLARAPGSAGRGRAASGCIVFIFRQQKACSDLGRDSVFPGTGPRQECTGSLRG